MNMICFFEKREKKNLGTTVFGLIIRNDFQAILKLIYYM